eukprot:CAMPEP_0180792518 /NCGR_PEP_ID=MMETSP1038_2-20121128/54452_1 /TAXON_ID=632150 /ORGANISM="Azadinium spinosum, Strain 3D9" /LENGTH=39 /DNA_ID= /DNA_START= /DNA_END= /DNA_ORIENTATION=
MSPEGSQHNHLLRQLVIPQCQQSLCGRPAHIEHVIAQAT